MSNPYYTASGNPGTGAPGASLPIRAEFQNLQAAFNLLPALSGNANLAVVVNGGGSALTVTTGQLALGANLTLNGGAVTFTGSFTTTWTAQANVTLTLPAVSGTLATLAGTETLTNKTLTSPTINSPTMTTPALGTPASGVLSNCTGFPTATNGQNFLAADLPLNNVSTVFNGPNTGAIGAAGQVFEITAVFSVVDAAGPSNTDIAIHDGTNYVVGTRLTTASANVRNTITLVYNTGVLAGPTTYTMKVQDSSSISGFLATSNACGLVSNKATSIAWKRLS